MNTEITLPKINFSLATLRTLSPIDAKKYIDLYFYPLNTGYHAFYDDGAFNIMKSEEITKTYFNRMSSELKAYYFKEKIDIRRINYDVNKPVFYDDCINLCPSMLHKYLKFEEHSEKAKRGAILMLKHIKDVICSSDPKQYEFLCKWIGNMLRGNKNDSCIYVKGQSEGTGKSTPFEFIREFVIGNSLCVQTGSGPLKKDFNQELEGRLMVVFEELENFNSGEWAVISCKLKRIITSNTIMIEGKGVNAKEIKNINNYILITNNDAIKEDGGRRYMITDISTHRLNDREYFKQLYDTCFNKDVGAAFYAYMLEVDLTGYNAQDFPESRSKNDAYVKRIDPVHRFLKESFVLKRKGIDKITVPELFEDYVEFVKCTGLKQKGKIDFCKSLTDLGIVYKKSNCSNKYNVTLEELDRISKRFKWMHELDEYEEGYIVPIENKPIEIKPTEIKPEPKPLILPEKPKKSDKERLHIVQNTVLIKPKLKTKKVIMNDILNANELLDCLEFI